MGENGSDRTVAAVMGANLRRLRADHRLEDLVRNAQAWGLKWTTGTAANCEAGRSAPTVTTICLLTLALEDLLGRPVAPAELLDGAGTVTAGASALELRILRSVLSNDRVERPRPASQASTRAWVKSVQENWPDRLQRLGYGRFRDTKAAMAESDIKAGRTLGLDPDRTAAEMADLWGRPLSVERDEIAGAGANAQRRGIVTRQLKAQLTRQVTDGND